MMNNYDELEVYYYNLGEIYNKSGNQLFDWIDVKNSMKSSTLTYLTNLNNENVAKLINPLIYRWNNNNIALVASLTELDFTDSWTRDRVMMPIWNKLDIILEEKLKEYDWLQTLLDSELKNETTTNSTSRHNDTPNANNNYSAEEYTSDINQSTNTTSSTFNSMEVYDTKMNRLHNIQQEIINEMKEFEIWMY